MTLVTRLVSKKSKKVASTFENRNGAVVSLQHENHKKALATREKV